ncbi:MAG: molybdate ABC transporter permease subunit [Epsilonproteobacteria bacterium]|nr:molybdate ABC transporter permease subunit [Campylobacterota bacterium]
MFNIVREIELTPFLISFKLASITTAILFIISIPLAWYLSQTKSRVKPLIETITALPIVLPPSVIGFYMLIILSQDGLSNLKLLFSFEGLVVASIFYSLPFMVQPIQSGFETLDRAIIEASYLSGKGGLVTLFRVALPNIKPSLITASIITFAHTIGEFGVVLMVGGNIEGETKVASVAIYEFVEIMDYRMAHIYSAIMLIVSFIVLISVYILNRRVGFR